jgi:hypothetical protein
MDERKDLRRWVRTWKDAGPELEAIRRREIREADNLEVLGILEEAFNHALATLPPRPSSGMVEMQAWFRKVPRPCTICFTRPGNCRSSATRKGGVRASSAAWRYKDGASRD